MHKFFTRIAHASNKLNHTHASNKLNHCRPTLIRKLHWDAAALSHSLRPSALFHVLVLAPLLTDLPALRKSLSQERINVGMHLD